uniref:Uncharacterized protein n=1 Tax=Avena sativa TaxID=4498 RepID=A0ACD5VBD5_AVESA
MRRLILHRQEPVPPDKPPSVSATATTVPALHLRLIVVRPGGGEEAGGMNIILDSPLMGEFIGFLKANWDRNSRVSQRRHRLRQLVAMVRGVADATEGRAVRGSSLNLWLQMLRNEALQGEAVLDATSDPSAVVGSAKKFLAGVKALFVCSAEVDRLTDAVEALEPLAGPGADLDIFLKVLHLDAATAAMDVDDDAPYPVRAVDYVDEGSYSVASAPGGKRKRGGSSGVDQAEEGDGDGEGEGASHGRVVGDRAYRYKRRALANRRHLSSGPPLATGADRSVAVAKAMVRMRRRIETPRIGRQRFSRISLQ